MSHILVVDDDDAFREVLCTALRRAEFEVSSARCGREAILLNKDNEFDAIVLDVVMPDGDGLETLQTLRGIEPGLPVVVISGGGRMRPESYLPVARLMGASAVMAKPFLPTQLIATVRKLIDGNEEDDGC